MTPNRQYVRLSKTVYGMLRAALLFYNERLQSTLENTEFNINPYDSCVANMMVGGGQITVCWHVDNLKISHRDEAMVRNFVMALADKFGPKTILLRGKVRYMIT